MIKTESVNRAQESIKVLSAMLSTHQMIFWKMVL